MKPVNSYGILLYREGKRKKKNKRQLEVFLVKPNGPSFWQNYKSSNVWGIPKGRCNDHEQPLETAHREFYEETGVEAPKDLPYRLLPPLVTYRGKVITIYTADASGRKIEWAGSNLASQEWPVGSGKIVTYNETVAGYWFPVEEALNRIGAGQRTILQALLDELKTS